MSTKKKKRISTQRRPSINFHENNENQEANSSKFTEKEFVLLLLQMEGIKIFQYLHSLHFLWTRRLHFTIRRFLNKFFSIL